MEFVIIVWRRVRELGVNMKEPLPSKPESQKKCIMCVIFMHASICHVVTSALAKIGVIKHIHYKYELGTSYYPFTVSVGLNLTDVLLITWTYIIKNYYYYLFIWICTSTF